MSAHVEVQGLARMQRTMRRAGLSLDEFKEVHRRVARTVAVAGRGLAPHRTGRLAASVRGSGTKAQAVVRAGTGRNGAVPYAGVIHWGWEAHNITAQPFASRAATDTEPEWLGDYERHIDRTIRQVRGL